MHEIDRLYDFLKKRKSQSKNKLCLVNVLQIGGGKENYCLNNADDNSLAMGYGVVSGWLALPSKVQGNDWQKQFTQHWWNYDWSHRQHLDFSPNIDEDCIYIQDDQIAKFVDENKQTLKSHVSSSVIMRNDMYYGIDYGENGYRFHPIEALSMQSLFFSQATDCIDASNVM